MDDKKKAALTVLREYPVLKREAAALRYELEYHTGGKSKRPTEDAAQRLADDKRLCSWEQKAAAVERVVGELDRADRELIELVYWRATHNITGAGMLLHLSTATAYRRMDSILRRLSRELEKVEKI